MKEKQTGRVRHIQEKEREDERERKTKRDRQTGRENEKMRK